MESKRRKDRRRRKSPAPGRIRTHNLMITRRVLYCCATIAAPLLQGNDFNHFLLLCTFPLFKSKSLFRLKHESNEIKSNRDVLNRLTSFVEGKRISISKKVSQTETFWLRLKLSEAFVETKRHLQKELLRKKL